MVNLVKASFRKGERVVRSTEFAALAFLLLVVIADIGFAQATGDRVLVQDPAGLLAKNDKAKDAVALLNWILLISGAVPATLFTIMAGKKFNDQEYGAALGSAIGAVVAGLGGYIAFSFM